MSDASIDLPRKRPSGRRAGDSGTRDAIFEAARDLFADLGYEGASVRAIATAAGVDPALIRHFFGDKETLFSATVAHRASVPERMAEALVGDPEQLGARVVDTYLHLWEDEETGMVLRALVRSAATSEAASQMLSEALGSRASEAAARLPGGEGQFQRIALAMSHLLGIAITRFVLKLPAITALSRDELVAEITPAIQRYLTGTNR